MVNGPKNSTSYRFYKANNMEEFDDPTAINLMESRLGEEKIGKTFKYGKSHAKTIQGVTWFVDESLIKSHPGDFPTQLDLLKPKKLLSLITTTTLNGEKITTKIKVVNCVIKIKWLIDGAYVSTWESRQTVRRIWGLERGDKGIFEAAQHQEKLFDDWYNGKREGRDRTATPFRGFDRGETPGPEEGLGKKVQFQ
jgi:predicted NACHT family NTPase